MSNFGYYDEWVMDVSVSYSAHLARFMPYNRDTGEVIAGLLVISEKCPGKLIGVIHIKGQAEADAWCKNNPDWLEKYSQKGD